MIERIQIGNFKSFKKIDLHLSNLNVFIGTNASGKSNFFDALRVIQGIGNGFTINEIFESKPKSATSEVWDGIRGGPAQACFSGSNTHEISIEVSGRIQTKSERRWSYRILFDPLAGKVIDERLLVDRKTIFNSEEVTGNNSGNPYIKVKYYGGRQGRQPYLDFERARPVLGQFSTAHSNRKKSDSDLSKEVCRIMANTQRIDPSPTILRGYSHAHSISRMGEHGENFAALVRVILEDESAKSAYLSWLKQLRPSEVEQVITLTGAVGEPLFALVESGKVYPAPVLSDGTLRFAAIAAAFFQPDIPGLMTIEEVENGIHASRVRLLVELLRNRAEEKHTQILVTTHSPLVLSWLTAEEYKYTFLCARDEESGESTIKPLAEIPNLLEIIKDQPLSDLFLEGWLEVAR